LNQAGISNVKLYVGRAEELCELFEDRSFDVVFTNALLLLIGPGKIRAVIKDMLRIACKGLILVEWHDFDRRLKDRSGSGVFMYGYWVRDYRTLLKEFVPEHRISDSRLTSDIWGGGWKEFGAIVEVTLQ
jgi:ubiquinone/menaquinone biosynthesis C-methylase UbiE